MKTKYKFIEFESTGDSQPTYVCALRNGDTCPGIVRQRYDTKCYTFRPMPSCEQIDLNTLADIVNFMRQFK